MYPEFQWRVFMATKRKKQAGNRRRNGQFAPGNKAGRKFQQGKSGNPSGRPRRTKLCEALIAQLAEIAHGAGEETVAEQIAQALIKQALKGNVLAAREIADRTEGKPRQALDVDLNMTDWRQLAEAHGLSVDDVFSEAKRIIESIESAAAERDSSGDSTES